MFINNIFMIKYTCLGSDIIKKYNKRLILISILILLLGSYISKHKYKPKYEILADSDAFASYSNGLIYIGDKEFLNSIEVNDGDVLILDERDLEDPNMCIYNSCDISDKDIRNEILEVICCYEELYPSKWDRSIESMRLEWLCHNMAYCFNYRVEDSREVDLNNEDEEAYDNKVLNRILRI